MVHQITRFYHHQIMGLLAILIFFGIISSIPFPWNEPLENAFIDLQFTIRGNRQLSDNIVFVFIGDDDINAMRAQHDLPITRDYYAYMIYILNQLGAKVIGIDVLFDTADRIYQEYDKTFANMIQLAGNICLPMTFSELLFGYQQNYNSSPNLLHGDGPTFPIELFRAQAAGIGFSNFNQERVIKKVPLVVAYNDSLMLSFGGELARLYLGSKKPILVGSHHIILTDSLGRHHPIPIDRQGKLRVNHFGDIHHLRSVGFVDLLHTFETNPDSLDIKDKLIIIAFTASGIAKPISTPLSNLFPASLIHATVAENLIRQNYLKETPKIFQLLMVVLLALSAYFIFQFKQRIIIIFSSIGVLLGYWISAMIAFGAGNTILPLFYPSVAFLVVITYSGILKSLEWRRQEDAIKSLLNQQIHAKATELEEAKVKLAEIQNQLHQETTISERSRQLAEERGNVIRKLEKEIRDLQTYVLPPKRHPRIQFPDIVYSEHSQLGQVLDLVATVSKDDIPVLIMGETGTGKEMIARAIHHSSQRKNAPFVAINCGALSETLLESELFGHEKGSFTGAHSQRRGRFELANGGTIFLDEITETSPAFQIRLLRVLQENSFERLGGEQTITVDVRVIAATNKNLLTEMANNRFRSDLFYRLNGFPITVPPLRDRKEDIPLLVLHFLKKYRYTSIAACSDRAMEMLQSYHWPGNVRELENVVRRAAIVAQSDKRNIIRESDLPEEILKSQSAQTAPLDYTPLEDQILEMLRAFGFSRSAISQTAGNLGNRDRGTITEYFRGICFEHLVSADFKIEAAARSIANTTDGVIIAKVTTKINEYLNNLQPASTDLKSSEMRPDQLPSAFKGLPKKYHFYLHEVIKNFDKIH